MERVRSLPRLLPRAPDTHKGTYGRALIAAGSRGMTGAAVLAARGALRSGAGLVTVAVPPSLSAVLTVTAPEATQILLPEPGTSEYRARLLECLSGLKQFQAVAVGPGLGASGGKTCDLGT